MKINVNIFEKVCRKIFKIEVIESKLPPFKEGVKTIQPDIHLSKLTDEQYLLHFGAIKERI